MAPLKRKCPIFRVVPEGFLLTLGLVLLFIYTAAQIDRYLATRQLQALTQLTASTNAGNPNPGKAVPAESEAEPTPEARPAIVRRPGEPIGILRIARIHLEVPVLEGTSALTLNRGAGRIEGTAQPGEDGNIGIAGHRDSFFRGLKDVHVGDVIELGMPAELSTYVVDRIQIVTPDRSDVLQSAEQPSLTLVTCYPFHYLGRAPERYVVTAVLASPASARGDATAAAAAHGVSGLAI
jgi:sortase A